MSTAFGSEIKKKRLALERPNKSTRVAKWSLRQVAGRVGMSPCYLSEVERGILPPPMIDQVYVIADELGLDADRMVMLSGRIGAEVEERAAKNAAFSQTLCDMLRMTKPQLKMMERVAGKVVNGEGGQRKIRV